MVTDSPSQLRWPGAIRNFTIAIELRMTIKIVATIAMPPPSGTVLSPNLSFIGFETNPKRNARTLIRPVKNNDTKNEPARRITANTVNV